MPPNGIQMGIRRHGYIFAVGDFGCHMQTIADGYTIGLYVGGRCLLGITSRWNRNGKCELPMDYGIFTM